MHLAMAGPPKFDLQDGKVVSTTNLCAGSKLLRVQADSGSVQYEPGHVLALSIPKDGTEDKEGEGENKGKHGDGLKGPYTVTRGDKEQGTFDVVYRVIKGGRLSRRLATLNKGAPISFGGKFHVPIAAGISPSASSICLISTGVGLGPVLGYVEQAEREGEARQTQVYAGFRSVEDVIFEPEFAQIAKESGGRVQFKTCISELCDERYPPPPGYEGLRGRVTDAVPKVFSPSELSSTHFHLIGNGAMVKTMQAALTRAGVPDDHVTIEIYFNHKADVSDWEAEEVSRRLQQPAESAEWVGAES